VRILLGSLWGWNVKGENEMVTLNDIKEIRESTMDALETKTLDEATKAAKYNLFMIEKLWNEVVRLRGEVK
jgi:hypothetical protein